MFSKPNKSFFRKISFRLSLIFGLALIANSVIILSISYFLFDGSLKKKESDILKEKSAYYKTLYEKGGLTALQHRLTSEIDPDSQYLVVVTDSQNQNVLVKVPEEKLYLKADFENRISQIDPHETLSQFFLPDSDGHDPDEDDLYGVNVDHLGDYTLYVARHSNDREDILERYLSNLAITLILVFLAALIAGFYFSNRALGPLRNLLQTMQQIYAGNFKARVPVQNSGDELDQIGQLFNKMAGKIETLITDMQETIDQIAHDLRTPLTRLKASSELALLGNVSENEYKATLASNIENTAEIVNLIDTIMDISEAQAGILRLSQKSVDVTASLKDVIDLYSIMAEQKNIRLELNILDEITALADETRFKQVVSNLVSNAIKYSSSGTLITISTQIKENKKQILIQDQGTGISDADLPKIWGRLYRSPEARGEKGSGLGLSLVQSICKAHGWQISVESQKGLGSCFTLSL